MRPAIITYVAVSLIFMTSPLWASSQSASPFQPLFLVNQEIQETQAYQIYKSQASNDQAKIWYLIHLTEQSDHTFVRNNETYSGKEAAQGMIYKLNKYFNEVGCVEDFIEKIASYSRKSNKPYYIMTAKRQKIPAKDVLYNELKRLEAVETGHGFSPGGGTLLLAKTPSDSGNA